MLNKAPNQNRLIAIAFWLEAEKQILDRMASTRLQLKLIDADRPFLSRCLIDDEERLKTARAIVAQHQAMLRGTRHLAA